MTARLPRHTLEEFRDLPGTRRHQLIDGLVHATPPPGPRHQRIVGHVLGPLLAFESTGAGQAFVSPVTVILDDRNVVQPDVVFVRTANLGIVREDALRGAPDLVVEVLAPSTGRTDLVIKAQAYARAGVVAYWVLDADLQRLEAFQLEGGAYVAAATVAAPDAFLPADFPGLELSLRDVFGR